MIVEPLSEAQKRVNAIHAALLDYRTALVTASKIHHRAGNTLEAAAYAVAVEWLAPVFAAVDGREVVDAEPVEMTSEEILRNEG